MPGRKRKPTALKALAGNPGKRKPPKNEPKPSASRPEMPLKLSKDAKAEWKRIIDEAMKIGLATTLDHAVFRQYIYEWQAVEELEKLCREKGRHITTTVVDRRGEAYEGDVKRAPWDTSLVQHRQLLKGFLGEIGFTPASRSKVSTQKPEKENDPFTVFPGGKK